MADPNAAVDVDPFEQIARGGGAAPETESDDPFERIAKAGGVAPPQQSSTLGAAARGAERGILPALGSFPAIGAGAEFGAEAGSLLGPVGTAVGGLIGGGVGAIGGGALASKAQNWALSQLPDSWKDKLGLSERQEQIDEGEHPTASFLGGLLPYAITMRPGAVPKTALPENATALQRVLAHPATARLFGGAAMGGMELGQEKVEDPNISWPKVAIATGFGLVFNRPTKFGEAITELGARPARAALGLPSPTIAQAADAKVMGPGVTEQVFQGAHEQDPSAQMTAQESARQEQQTLKPEATPDIHEIARRMHPELFTHYDDLLDRQKMLRDWIDEQGADAAPSAVQHLAATDAAIAEAAPEVAAAYRRAAEATGAPTVPVQPFRSMADMLAAQGAEAAPRPTEGATPPRPIEEQRAYIAQDVARQMLAAGRPAAEAQAVGQVVAARYETRAGRFNGALGSAEELYNREGAEIRGRKAPPPPAAPVAAEPAPTPPIAPAEAAPVEAEAAPVEVMAKTRRGPAAQDPAKWSLLQHIAAMGGIRSDDPNIADLRAIIGKNKLIPGFGPLIRNPVQLSTAARRSGAHAPMYLDTARESAVESSYLQDMGDVTRGVSQSSVNDLLNAIEREHGGDKVYQQGYEGPARKEDPNDIARAEQYHEDRKTFFKDLDDYAKDKLALTDKERDRAFELHEKGGMTDVAEIVDRIALELDNEEIESGFAGPREWGIPGWDLPHEPAGTPGAGEAVAPEQSGEPRGGAARTGGGSAGEEAEIEYFQKRRPRDLIAEREAEGQQNLPGTERITPAEQAQRLANEPLKPGVPQKPADEGLFGERGQEELFQHQQTPIFYSQVQRTIDNAKQEKASPQQWLATIRNTPGVKPEELEWLGLEDWLKEQKGTVTRQQVADYVRANLIEVKEVHKGAGGNTLPEGYSAFQQPDGRWAVRGTTGGTLASGFPTEAEAITGAANFYGQTPGRGPKFAQYTLPGGENYRELLLTLPEQGRVTYTLDDVKPIAPGSEPSANDGKLFWYFKTPDNLYQIPKSKFPNEADARLHVLNEKKPEPPVGANYTSPHWNEPNIVAHIRFNDRTIDGKKTLFVEEVQSDWHQEGKRHGYQGTPQEYTIRERPDNGGWGVYDSSGVEVGGARTREFAEQIADKYRRGEIKYEHRVPDAPFKTTWPELALKRIIRYAAENGYDKVAWTPGEVQAARYDLSKQISKLDYFDDGRLIGYDTGGRGVMDEAVPPEKLADYIGKDAADKLLAQDSRMPLPGSNVRHRVLEGTDLKVGGEGMKGFYDDILPKAANKLVKKFGARSQVEQMAHGEMRPTQFANFDEYQAAQKRGETAGKSIPVHTLDITPDLRDAATEQGFPLFQGVAAGKVRMALPIGRASEKPIITLMHAADASTAIHELGHAWLGEMMRDSLHPQAPDDLKSDAKTVLDWLGASSPDQIKVRQHEKFARGFEQYLREGVAPSPQLASVFGKFRDWLLKIYQSIRGLGSEITPDIRSVFDRMLAQEPQRTVIAPERMERPNLADIHEADATHTEPAEAEPAMDRVLSEAERFTHDLPGEIQNAHAQTVEKAAAAAEAAHAATEAPTSGEQARPVQPDRAGPGPEPAGGAGGAVTGAELPGGGRVGAEGAAKPAGGEPAQSGVDASARDQGLADKPLAPRPSAGIGPRESPFLDKAGNIRLENLTNDADVRQAIRDAANENDDFIGDRRGVVTDGQVMDLALDLGMEGAEKLVRERVKGQAFNAEQVMALRRLLIQSATEVAAVMKKAAIGTDEDLMAYAIAKDRHQLIQATVAQATAEAGRALRAFRNIAGTEGQQNINEFLKSATGKDLFQLRREAKLGATLDTPQKVSKFIIDSQKHSFGRMILEYWINGLISGLATHMTYGVGNTILAAEKAGPETAAAAAIGVLRKSMGRTGETVRLGEVAEQFKAGLRAVPSATKAALDAIRTGVPVLLPGEHPGQNVLPFPGTELAQPAVLHEGATFSDVIQSAYGVLSGIKDGITAGGALAEAAGVSPPNFSLRYSHLGAIPDLEVRGFTVPVGTLARAPSRMVAAIHSFFRAVNYSMEKNADSYRQAANEGLTGTARDARIADLRANPSQEKMEQYSHISSELTLMGQGGEFTKALSRLTNTPIFGLPVFKFIDPFVHISSNIIEQAVIERTPVGLLSPEIRADLAGKNGNIAQDTAMARMLMGTVYAVGLGGLAAEGYVSGSEPSDPKQAAIWRLAGNQAHSVRIGDIWYDVHRLGPMGMLMGIAADMYDVSHVAASGDLLTAASHLQHAITQNILDESFMRGPSDLIKAIDDPGRYGEAYIRNWLSSFLPYSVGMAQMARASDPYSRQARSVMDAIRAKIPGMSESLLPRRDIWGEEMPNKDALIAAGVTAIYEQRMSRDPVNLALLDLGIYPAMVERKIRNVQLTDDQYDAYQRLAGRMTKMRLDTIVNSPDYRTWPNHIRHDVISEVITQSREAARGMMLMKNPQIARDATALKLNKLKD